MHNINFYTYLSILIITIVVGLVVFLRGKKNKSTFILAGIFLSTAFWVFCLFFGDTLKNEALVLIWIKLAMIGPSFLPGLILLFSLFFPSEHKEIKLNFFKLFLLFLPTLIILFFVPTRFNVLDIKIESWGANVTPGPLYIFLLIYFVMYLGLGFGILIKKYRSYSNIKQKIQIKYIIFGMVISVLIGLTTNLILVIFGTSFGGIFGPVAALFFSLILFYSIAKYQLLNIRLIITEIIVYIVLTILFIEVLFSKTIFEGIMRGLFFIVVSYGGYILITSTKKEIVHREQLEAANKELKRIDEAKIEFLSIASHQLRTPLTAIKGYLGMIEEGIYGDVAEKVKEILHKVNDSNERLIRLVNSLLDISRLELGRMEFDFEKVDIEEMLENIVDEFHIAARKKGLKLVFEHPKEKLPEITIDALKMRQVFLNLVDNAIKYTYEGEIIVKAELKDHGNERIRVSVSDTGMGIARNEIDQIFKIYRRGTGVRLFPEGSGVGLYVAKKIVEAHNGKIWVKSQGKGRGSTFYVEIPVKRKTR